MIQVIYQTKCKIKNDIYAIVIISVLSLWSTNMKKYEIYIYKYYSIGKPQNDKMIYIFMNSKKVLYRNCNIRMKIIYLFFVSIFMASN